MPCHPFPVSAAGRMGTGGHSSTRITHPRVCARYLWSIIALPATGTGLRGAEGMRNPSPAIPGISVLGRAGPGGARGRCWQSAAEGGGEGTDPGGDPVPCGSRAVSIHAGREAGWPEEPRCHHNLLLETLLARHPLTHLQARKAAAAKPAGLGRRTAPATGSSRLAHAEPHRPAGRFRLLTQAIAVRRMHRDARLLQGHRCGRATSSARGLREGRGSSAVFASPHEQGSPAIGEPSGLDLGPCGCKGNPRRSSHVILPICLG